LQKRDAMQRNESLIRLRNLLISLAVFASLVLYASRYAEPVLRVSVLPDQPPPVLRRKLKPLTDYLGQRIGIKMEFRPMLNGDTLVDALLGHQLDLVRIDDSYLARAQVRSNGRVIALVQREKPSDDGSEAIAAPGDYIWAVRTDMDSNLREKLTDAFLSLSRNSSQGRDILDLQQARRFIPARVVNRPVLQADPAQP
jgi:ABC-type phosphate/phosphonate transport system substrate-binding protein